MLFPTGFADSCADRIIPSLTISVLITAFVFYGGEVCGHPLQTPERDGARPKIETTEDGTKTKSSKAKSAPRAGQVSKPDRRVKKAQPSPTARTGKNGGLVTMVDPVIEPILVPSGASRPETAGPESAKLVELPDSRARKSSFSALLPLTWPVVIKGPLPSVEVIVSTFLDPKQSTRVTREEWQAVLVHDEEALRERPDDGYLKARSSLARGQIAYLQGDLTAALAAFNEATQVRPDLLWGALGAGHVYLARNSVSEAIKSFQQVIRLDPKSTAGYKALGDVYSYSRRYNEAIEMYRRARELGFTGIELTNALEQSQIRILLGERRWQQALPRLRAFAENAPAAEVYLDLGQCYEELNQRFSAAQAYSRAIELDPRSAAAHFCLGNLLFQNREYQAAADAFERAVTLDPAGIRINLLQARKNLQEARKKVPAKR